LGGLGWVILDGLGFDRARLGWVWMGWVRFGWVWMGLDGLGWVR
jgi:hypothetical protein